VNSAKPPLRIAHAYGNNRNALRQALAASIDMIEADIWFRAGKVWIHHERRLGPLPLLMDRQMRGHPAPPLALPIWPRSRYYVRPDFNPLGLGGLLDTVGGKRGLLLDAKGNYEEAENNAFTAAVTRQVSEHDATDWVVVCGQNWKILETLREQAPRLEVRYSLEKPWQWDKFLRMIDGMDESPRICMEHRLIDEEKVRFLEERGIDVYCWTVDDPAKAKWLVAAGVDGIISNNLSLLASLGGSWTTAGG